MSKTTIAGRVREPVKDAVQEYQDANGIESTSEAIERLTERSLVANGYLCDGAAMTPARRLAREVAKLLAYVAATFWVLGVIQSSIYFSPALSVGAAAASAGIIERWLIPRLEPELTKRLPRVEVSRRGSAR